MNDIYILLFDIHYLSQANVCTSTYIYQISVFSVVAIIGWYIW